MHGARPVNGGDPQPVPPFGRSYGAAPPMPAPLLAVQDVVKEYRTGSDTVTALRHVNFGVYEGQFIAIRGRSGAGKTTLLNIIAGLDNPTQGRVIPLGRDLATLNEDQRTELRRTQIGFVFQSAHLVAALTARENVEVPLRLARMAHAERERRSSDALALVGLSERAQHRPPELSGGEQQRISIARALVHAPRLVLADEPTGALDSHTGASILQLMIDVAHSAGIGFIITTHDPQASALADAVYDISDGVLTPGVR